MSFSLSRGARHPLFTTAEQICTVCPVSRHIIRQKRLTFLATRLRLYLGIISPVDRFFFYRRAEGPAVNLSSLRPESVSLSLLPVPPPPPPPRHSPHPTFLRTMHFLLESCLLTSFFSFSLHAPRESRGEERSSTSLLPPLLPAAVHEEEPGPVFGGPTSRGPVKFRRRVVYRADEFSLYADADPLSSLGYVTARRHLCRGHPKGPTTPDPRGPLSHKEFEIARHTTSIPRGRPDCRSAIFLCVLFVVAELCALNK